MSTTNPSTTADATTLYASPQLRRLTENLHDLIIISLERYTKAPGNSFVLTRLEYVSGENNDARSYMHFDAQVKELGRLGNIPLRLSIIVETPPEDESCYLP